MPVHNHFLFDQSGKANPNVLIQIGAFFPIEIHVPPAIADALTKQGQPIPPPATGVALIDTGATMTCVHEPLLQALGLNPTGVVSSGTANGPVQQNAYVGRIHIPTLGWVLDVNGLVGVNLTGQEIATNPPQPVVALLGRNFLQQFVLVWNGPGGFWTIAGL